jgi:hypothetical protein
MKAAIPSMVVYMVKLDGRYDILAWNMPGDVAMMVRKVIATRGFQVEAILVNRRVSQNAQTNPRTRRTK